METEEVSGETDEMKRRTGQVMEEEMSGWGDREWEGTCKNNCVVICCKFQCDWYITSPLQGENLQLRPLF